MFPVCGEDRGTTTTPVVVLVVDPVDSPSSDFEKFLRNFQNCEDGSTRSTPRKKVEEYLVVFSGSEDTLFAFIAFLEVQATYELLTTTQNARTQQTTRVLR